MRLSMTGEYAIRAMLHLASKEDENIVQISEISKEQAIPEALLRKIVAQFVKLGFIHSYRGTGGGISLAKPAESITLLNIIEAIEGKIFLNQCLISPEFCDRTQYCSVHLVWKEAQEKLIDILNSKTIEYLARQDRILNQVTSY